MSSAEKYGAGCLTDNHWESRWDDEKIGFHKTEVHSSLIKYMDTMINGRAGIKIFFPLCGKSVDMKWLADKGFTVVGVELAAKACQTFFQEQNVEFTSETKDKFTVFKSKDEKIRLYCGNLFEFNSSYEGKMDAIWDRASLVAINKEDRKKYSDVMTELMKPETRGLLLTFHYESETYPGPPHCLSENDINEVFGEKCNIKLLEYYDAMEERHKAWGTEVFFERVQLLTPKQ